MFFNKRKPKDIPIDEFVFSPEDIFVLLGGFDPAMFACNIYTMNLSRIAEERPDREEWRRKMIKRFQPHGLVDEEGNPCPALAEALAPLRAREIVVTNGPERTRTIEMRTIELAVAGGRATTLVSERGVLSGRIQGFRIVPLGTDRSAWNKWLAETLETQEIMDAVDASYYPFVGTQILDAQGNGAGMEHGNIFTAIKHGDRDTAKAWGGNCRRRPSSIRRSGACVGSYFYGTANTGHRGLPRMHVRAVKRHRFAWSPDRTIPISATVSLPSVWNRFFVLLLSASRIPTRLAAERRTEKRIHFHYCQLLS